MSLISESFILLVLLLIAVYYTIPKRFQWACLLVCSGVFYCFTSVKNAVYIVATALTVYACALAMDALHQNTKRFLKEKKQTLSREERSAYKKKQNRRCRLLLALTLVLNVGCLCLFKYSGFLLTQLDALFPNRGLPTSLGLIAPLGISFYTFQSIGYLVDVYWEKTEAQRNPAKMLLFVSFFPQITQGPISEYNQLAPQLFSEHRFRYENLSGGVQRMIWGFFKKMVIADHAAPIVKQAFLQHTTMNGNNVLLSAFLYSLWIYADFSGYMDIVCGLCKTLDLRLTENFDHPYFSKSVAEYWRRWHISLGAWFKTYLYYPIAVSRFSKKCSKTATKLFGSTFGKTTAASVALVAVWLTTGLWHGASWAYIAWGGLNGVFIILSLWLEPLFRRAKTALHVRENTFAWRAFATLRTFFLVTLIKVFPEVGGFSEGLSFWKHCFTNWKLSTSLGQMLYPIYTRADMLVLVGGALLLFVTSLISRKRSLGEVVARWPAAVKYLIFVVMFLAIFYLGVPAQSGGGFLYAQF